MRLFGLTNETAKVAVRSTYLERTIAIVSGEHGRDMERIVAYRIGRPIAVTKTM